MTLSKEEMEITRTGKRRVIELLQYNRWEIIANIKKDIVNIVGEEKKAEVEKYFDENWTFFVPTQTTYADGKVITTHPNGNIIESKQIKRKVSAAQTSERNYVKFSKPKEQGPKNIRNISIENIE